MNAQDHDDDHQHEHHTPPLETGDGHERLSGGHLHGDTSGAPATSDTHGAPHHLFRAAATGRTDVVGTAGMDVLQRTVGNAALGPVIQRARAAAPEQGEETETRSPVHDVISSGGGTPLDTETRTDLEGRMGADFSDVRIHNDSAAHESAKGVGAHAYTVGNNVVFQRDAYDPSSPQGRTTLAHELTHVIQQRNGPVEGTGAPGACGSATPRTGSNARPSPTRTGCSPTRPWRSRRRPPRNRPSRPAPAPCSCRPRRRTVPPRG